MSGANTNRFRHGIERCLCKSEIASSTELRTLWLFAAESYRFLLERECREQERGTWEWNAAAMIKPKHE
jgi:hypothetical protein